MVTFPNGGMSDDSGSMRPAEGGSTILINVPKFKARRVSVVRHYPYMCGPEYEHFGAEPEETAAASSGGDQNVGVAVQNQDRGKKPYYEGGLVIHEEGSATSSKKRLPKRNLSVKRDSPKHRGLNATPLDVGRQAKVRGQHGNHSDRFKPARVPISVGNTVDVERPPGGHKPVQNQPEVAWNKKLKASQKTPRVCADDLSLKQELYPISVVNTVDDERPPVFTYITQLIYPEGLRLRPGKGCSCAGKCSDSKKCSCARRNGGKFPYDKNGHLLESKDIVYECGPHCKCPPSCYNRVGQKGIKIPLQVFKTDNGRGWGVRPLTYISSGSFICEYFGEVIDDYEVAKRLRKDDYMFNIGQKLPGSETETRERYTVDGRRFGNVSRLINHSCAPNVRAEHVLYDHDDVMVTHMMFFAARHIPALEELTCDYLYVPDKVQDARGNIRVKKCLCGARRCTGRVY